jgi:hypothetical protein
LTGAYANVAASSELRFINIALVQRHIKQAPHLGCGASRDKKKFHEVFIRAPIETFGSIVHHRYGSPPYLVYEAEIFNNRPLLGESVDSICEFASNLPGFQVLESFDGYAHGLFPYL